MKNLLPWLPFVSVVLLVGMSWGHSQSKLESLADRMAKVEQRQENINQLAITQAVIDTRTRHIEAQVLETKRLLENMRANLLRGTPDER